MLLFSVVYKAIGYQIATNDWEDLLDDIYSQNENSITYQATQFGKISEISLERMELADASQRLDVCDECFEYLVQDEAISAMEASLMVSLMEHFENDDEKAIYIEKVMEKANAAELSSISSAISEIELSQKNTAYDLAIAIHSVENISNYNYSDAYTLLKENEENSVYGDAVRHLAIALNNKGDIAVNAISEAEDMTRSEITEFLNRLEKND